MVRIVEEYTMDNVITEIVDEIIKDASDKEGYEIKQIEGSLRRIFRDANRKEHLDWDDSTDEEDIIAEFVEHRKCNGRCRVKYVVKQEDSMEEEVMNEDTEDNEEVNMNKDPENIPELRAQLKFIQENHEDFNLSKVDKLKKIFLSWNAFDEDMSEEIFEVYRDFMSARDNIRGCSDTEEDEQSLSTDTEEDDDSLNSDEEEYKDNLENNEDEDNDKNKDKD